MPVTDLDLYLFDLQGFLVLREVLGKIQIAELNKLIDANLKTVPGEGLESQVFQDFLLWGEPLRNLLSHRRVMDLLHQIVDEKIRLDRCYGLHMAPGTSGVPLHGGAKDVEDQSEYYSCSDGRIRNGITTVIWSLTDMLPDHGGFACIPGSHKSLLPRPASLNEVESLVPVPLKAGDVLVFTGALAHAGMRWIGPHTRRSLLFKYAPRHIAWGKFYFSWPTELLDLLTPEQRHLFDPPHCFEHNGIGVGT